MLVDELSLNFPELFIIKKYVKFRSKNKGHHHVKAKMHYMINHILLIIYDKSYIVYFKKSDDFWALWLIIYDF